MQWKWCAVALTVLGLAACKHIVNRGPVGDADITETLVRTTGKGDKGWEYHTDDNRIEHYDVEGRLSAIVDLAGRAVSLGYDPAGRLSTVSSPSGERLQLAYDSSARLARVSDHAGRHWQYRYDGLGRLAEVVNPDQTTRIYHYENPDHPYALTGITDERQVRFATYEYDRQGRAIASWHGEGAGRIDVSYANDGSREVRNGRGEASTYHALAQQGTGLLGSTQGSSSTAAGPNGPFSCPYFA